MAEVAAGVHRRLVPGRHVRHGQPEQPVEPAQHVQVERPEGVPFGLVERGDVGHLAVRVQVHLVGPAGGPRHERRPVRIGRHHPHPGPAFGGEDVGVQVAPGLGAVGAGGVQQQPERGGTNG